MPELKKELEARGLDTKGLKAELVERLEKYGKDILSHCEDPGVVSGTRLFQQFHSRKCILVIDACYAHILCITLDLLCSIVRRYHAKHAVQAKLTQRCSSSSSSSSIAAATRVDCPFMSI